MNPEKLIRLSKLITNLKESVKCFICQDYIKNAAQIKCGHTFCDKFFRDEFLNLLSKFVDKTCRAIKEEYIEDVEVLQYCSNKDIAIIIESAPRNIHDFSSNLKVGLIKSKGMTKDGIDKVVQGPKRSNNELISDSDNCAIVEVQSEDIVKQMEISQINQNQYKRSKRNSAHSFDNINLTSNFENPGPSRLGNVKKPLRILKPKEQKKLIIVKKRHNANDSVKDTTIKSRKVKCQKNVFKSCTSIQNKENPIKTIMKGNQEVLESISNNVIDVIEISDSLENINNKNVSDDNAFHIATQKTAESVEQRSYHFPPVSENINDIDSLINIFSENVNNLLEETTNFNDEVSLNFVTCFTNLKTYIKRLHQLNLEQNQEVHLIPKVKINISTQTKHIKNDKQVQTSQTSFNEIVFETPNNSQNCRILTKTNSSKRDKESAIIKDVFKSFHPSNMNSAIDMKASQKTQSSVLLHSLKSSEIRVPKKKVRRLFDDDNVRETKRIHQLSNDNYDKHGPAKRTKIIRDDLTVELEDSEYISESDMSRINLGESDTNEDMDYYNYLLDDMEKYETPQKQIYKCTDNKDIPHTETTGNSDREKDQQNDGNGLFSRSGKYQKSRNLSIAVNTECSVIKNMPTVQPAKKSKFLDSKSKNDKTSLNELDKQVLNKDSASNDKIVPDQLFSMFLHHDTSTEDAPNIINNEKHVLSEGFEELQTKRNEEMETSQKRLTHSIDEFLKEIGIDNADDKEIERELESINFTAEMNKLKEKDNSKILKSQNVKIPEFRIDRDKDITNVIVISDDSETEVVETTRRKKKKLSFNRTLVVNLEQCNFDIFLSPPPEFGKDIEDTSLQPKRLAELIEPGKDDQSENIPNQDIHRSNENKDIVDDLYNEMFSPIATSSQNLFKLSYPPLVNDSSPNIRKPNILSPTPNQKSILNCVNFSQNKNKLNKSKPCIMWSRISNEDIINVFRQLELKRLITTSEHFTAEVTHLIVEVDKNGKLKSHTAKFLLAVAAGIWVVRWEWVVNCLKMNAIASEEPYEVLDISGVPGPRMSRLTKIKNPLFQEYIFFCAPTFSTISINDIKNTVKMLDGEIADELDLLLLSKKFKIILTDRLTAGDLDKFDEWLKAYKTVTVDIEWFIKCVAQYKLLSFRSSVLCSEDTIFDLNYPDVLVESLPFVLTETF
ncbi:hypothetical protein GWI33_022849 [Rhynchophorus ferrugineus]|uniref:BRCT domain-containing protein n=1 Tax=Rhynchophorus ferrugineus TaxID=354439 RepID=A0A834IMI7_RHYFE|nr:hypothetical protein GWI33_022849 [Rhynchophorus ferrugineus]